MTLRQYLTVITFTTAICWVSWLFILFNVDPLAADTLGFGLFYSSLLLALIGSISVIYFIVYLKIHGHIFPVYRLVRRSFKNACLFSGIIVSTLIFQGLNWLNWWNLPMLAAVFLLLIFYNHKGSLKAL